LAAFWREPVFTKPILIFESDDWGPGPPEHAAALAAIATVLRQHRDTEGHPPVMTLGVTLAIPESHSSAAVPLKELTLDDPQFSEIVQTMKSGVQDGVFQLQLHGRSHYWAEALTKAAASDRAVADWLASADTWRTETLPDGLQTRWAPEIDGQRLIIPTDTVRSAAAQEARLFEACFGSPAAVAVPTTFVWNPAVEQGWSSAGIRAVVTPGRYHEHRGQFGQSKTLITNGMQANGIDYVVRDRYFEPFKGHGAHDGLLALQTNTALGRPTLLETHRVNFLEPDLRARALSAMHQLLEQALGHYAELRFVSTVQLVDIIAARSPDLVARSLRRRLAAWATRVRTLPRFWKLARLTGLALAITGAARLARPA
jgi:hypothetical protein